MDVSWYISCDFLQSSEKIYKTHGMSLQSPFYACSTAVTHANVYCTGCEIWTVWHYDPHLTDTTIWERPNRIPLLIISIHKKTKNPYIDFIPSYSRGMSTSYCCITSVQRQKEKNTRKKRELQESPQTNTQKHKSCLYSSCDSNAEFTA